MKKTLSLLVAVALVVSLFASVGSVSAAGTAGEQLKAIGVIKGDTSGSLNETSTWDKQDLAVLISRLVGKEEVAAATAKSHTFADIADDYYDGYISWAKAAGYITGISATEFGFNQPVSYKVLNAVLLRVLGYDTTGANFDNTEDLAVEVGISEATDFDAAAIRGIAYGSILKALDTKVKGTEKSLGLTLGIKAYVDAVAAKEAADKKAAEEAAALTAIKDAEAKKAAEEAAKLKVLSVTAINPKQVVVTFNNVVDATTSETAANYTVGGVAFGKASLQADKKSVLLTLAAETKLTNAATADVKVLKAVKTAAGKEMDADYAATINVSDASLPTIEKVVATGLKTIQITFSEPVYDAQGNVDLETDQITVKSGSYSYTVTAIKADYAARTVTLTVGTNLIAGDVTVKINAPGMVDAESIRDFAGLTVLTQEKVFTYAADTAVATAAITKIVKETKKATVTFSKAVYGSNVKLYHSVNGTAAYATAAVTKTEANAATEWEFTFDNALPSGALTFYLANSDTASEQLTDLYGVKVPNASYAFTVVADTTAPSVSSVTVNTNASIDVAFNEDADATELVKAANYEIVKPDGTKISFTTSSVDAKTVRLTASLEDNVTYTVKVVAAKDVAGNATTSIYSVAKTVGDNTNPTVSSSYATGTKTIYVVFSEAMNTTDITTKSNFQIDTTGANTTYVNLGDNDTITLVNSKKIKITWAADNFAGGVDDIKIGPVRDSAGKRLGSDTTFSTTIQNVAADTLTLASAQLTATNKVKLTFSKELGSFDNTQFVIRKTNDAATAETYNIQSVQSNTVNADGVSEVVVVLDRDFSTDAKDSAGSTVEVFTLAGNGGTKSVEATTLTASSEVAIADKVAPSVKYVVYQSPTQILVRFNEQLEADSFAASGKNGFAVTGGTLTSALISGGADSTDVILTGTDFTINTDVTYTGGNIVDQVGGNSLAAVTKADAQVNLVAAAASTPDATATVTVANYTETFTAANATNLFDNAGAEIVGGATIGEFNFMASGFTEVGTDQLTIAITTGGVLTLAFTDGAGATGAITGTVVITNITTGAKDTINVSISAGDVVTVTNN